MKEDHRSYRRNFCSCQKKAWKKSQACKGFEPLTSAIPVQHSYQLSLQAKWEQVIELDRWYIDLATAKSEAPIEKLSDFGVKQILYRFDIALYVHPKRCMVKFKSNNGSWSQ